MSAQSTTLRPISSIPLRLLMLHILRRMAEDKTSLSSIVRKIKRDWMAGVSVIGYGTWRWQYTQQHPKQPIPAACPGYPPGWSLRNLQRLIAANIRQAKSTTAN